MKIYKNFFFIDFLSIDNAYLYNDTKEVSFYYRTITPLITYSR